MYQWAGKEILFYFWLRLYKHKFYSNRNMIFVLDIVSLHGRSATDTQYLELDYTTFRCPLYSLNSLL